MSRQREIQINLLNYKYEKQTLRKRRIMEWGVYLAIAIVLVAAMWGLSYGKRTQITQLKQANQQLQAQLNQTTSQTASLVYKEKIEEQINTRKKLVSEVKETQITFGSVYETLGEMDISGILLINVDVNPGSATFKGLSTDHASMVEFLAWLRENKPFGDISDLTYNVNEETGEISFSILAGLEVSAK